jgi:adenosylmethionine-8-amino-7-oxononanoate aminotransferase
MGNPMACSVANASIELLLSSPWQQRITNIEAQLKAGLAPCMNLEDVADVRVLGAIGVVELKQAVDMSQIQQAFVDAGVWIRPFGKLVYLMPPYIINNEDLATLTKAIFDVINDGKQR